MGAMKGPRVFLAQSATDMGTARHCGQPHDPTWNPGFGVEVRPRLRFIAWWPGIEAAHPSDLDKTPVAPNLDGHDGQAFLQRIRPGSET